MKAKTVLAIAVLFLCGIAASGQSAEDSALQIGEFRASGAIEGENITFGLDFHIRVVAAPCELPLVTGRLALLDGDGGLPAGVGMRYDGETGTYYLLWPRKTEQDVSVRFAVWPEKTEGGEWREATFAIPTSRIRELALTCDRTDLEVVFPGALKQTRTVDDNGVLKITALLGPGKPLAVRWKPQVTEMEGKLVLSSDANTVATVGAGALRLDNLYLFKVAQGKLRRLQFEVPANVNVTQVRCPFIRDWQIAETDGRQILEVILNRPVGDSQPVQILAETALDKFPVEFAVPIINPLGVIRASGQIGIGTNSAIQLLVASTAGLSQVDAGAFPVMLLSQEYPRPIPDAKTFFYTYATTPYQLKIGLADIVPAYDASSRLVFNVKEDNLTLAGDLELDIRDAGIRGLRLLVDPALVVSGVSGAEVEDFSIRDELAGDGRRQVDIQFRHPVMGRSLLNIQAELGSAPIGKAQRLQGIEVAGAESQRGYTVLVAEKGVQLGQPVGENLRRVHTASIPLTVPNAQFAYRFRSADWSIVLTPAKKPASVLAEAFHLVSVAEGIAYGSTLVNYFISGAPLDEFRFRIPEEYRNVEFVGREVRRWDFQDGVWVVKLQRKVIGDFNLGITFNQRPDDDNAMVAGGCTCIDVETENGYISVASGLNMELRQSGGEMAGLLEIKQDEIPANYRLLAKLPILKSYKYVGAPHDVPLRIVPYAQGSVLPILVEVMQADTSINVNNDGQTQAVTSIRYKLKNSSSQYLNLKMPAETAYWTVRQIEADGPGGETSRNVVAQRDAETGMLMIPLQRKRNPNDPITIELEYGQVFGRMGWFGELLFTAPGSPVESTYSQWNVRVPEKLALQPGAKGTMLVERPVARGQGALGELLAKMACRLAWTVRQFLRAPQFALGYAIVSLLALGVCAVFRPRSFLPGIAATALALAAVLGAATVLGLSLDSQPGSLRAITFNQALDLESSTGAAVSVRVTPAWLGGVDFRLLAGWGVAVLAGLALALAKRRLWRFAGLAMALVGLASLGAQFPLGARIVAHAVGWGLPGLAALLSLVAFCKVLRLRHGVSAGRLAGAAAVLCCLALSGRAHAMASPRSFPGYESTARSVEARLFAEKDHMLVEIDLAVETIQPLSIPLVDLGAVMMVPAKLAAEVEIVQRDGMYVLAIAAPGQYVLNLRFLAPLPVVEESQQRSFSMPLPMALTNRVVLTIPRTGMEVVAGGAIRFVKTEQEESTVATATFAPGRELLFVWQPRSRETRLEATSFFAEVNALFRFDAGLAEGRHRVHFQIAQGELKEITLAVPENMAVTAVSGAGIGAWRFDPASREVEIKLAEPAVGDYVLAVATQMASDKLPARFSVGAVKVLKAVNQRGTIGIVTTPAVYAVVESHSPELNIDDYLRDASPLLREISGLDAKMVRHAFRASRPEDRVELSLHEVKPEIRTAESAGFTVADDRIVYSGNFTIVIAKAGLFSLDLKLSPDYDIDALSAPQVSHWDEISEAGQRIIRIHFRSKMMGQCPLNFALSRPVAGLPPEIAVPHIEAVGALKHSGQVTLSTDRGIRLTVKPGDREGVSEIDPSELGVRDEQILAFKLLKPDWRLVLKAELVEPRVNVEFLHVARVSEGMVRHRHHLLYRLHNAGSKFFEIAVPGNALGLQVTGPNIARLEEAEEGSGIWRIELAAKVFDRPFPLTVAYETKFDHAAGELNLRPVRPVAVDLQRGFVVVFGSERVELHPVEDTLAAMQSADPRTVPAKFGQEDLAGAAFCFTAAGGDYDVRFTAIRHQAAELLTAEVLSTNLTTVVTDQGEMISQVAVQLRSGDRRHLEISLPAQAEMWSLLVNGGATIPSKRTVDGRREVILVPLGQSAGTELAVIVEFIFVSRPDRQWTFGKQLYAGPEFDVPLKNIIWTLYVPGHWRVDNFGGTLNADERVIGDGIFQEYDMGAYERKIQQRLEVDLRNAKDLQDKGFKLAREGNVYEAKQALEWAYNYSYADPALNEDARVQLNKLMQEQAVAGLVQRRGGFRQKGKTPDMDPPQGSLNAPAQIGGMEQTQGLDAQTVTRLQSSLSKADSENLERITDRIIEAQDAAVGNAVQLVVNMPLRGRVLNFTRPLQVKPNAPMLVTFEVEAKRAAQVAGWVWTAALAAAVCAFLALCAGGQAWVARSCARAAAMVVPEDLAAVPEDFTFEELPAGDEDDKDAGETVSADSAE